MNWPILLAAVEKDAGLRNRQHAVSVSASVLAPLLARLSYLLAARLLETLPPDVARGIETLTLSAGRYEPFERYVAQVMHLDRSESRVALERIAAVMSALDNALPDEVMYDIAAEAPTLFVELFPRRRAMVPATPASPLQSREPVPLWSASESYVPRYLLRRWAKTAGN